MDSKAIRRVCDSLQTTVRFDSKLKTWFLGEGKEGALVLSSAEVEKMSSLDLRMKLTPKGETLVMRGKQMVAESKDKGGDASKDAKQPAAERRADTVAAIAEAAKNVIGHPPVSVEGAEQQSDAAKAAELLQKQSGGSVTAAMQEHAANVAAGKATDMKKVKKGKKAATKPVDPNIIQVACVKVTFPTKKKARRDVEDGKIWLPGVGISKWQTRQKMIARENKEGAKELNKNKTQYLTPAEAKQFAKFVFDETDKKVLANKEKYSERAVKYAEDARDAAEALLAAAAKA